MYIVFASINGTIGFRWKEFPTRNQALKEATTLIEAQYRTVVVERRIPGKDSQIIFSSRH